MPKISINIAVSYIITVNVYQKQINTYSVDSECDVTYNKF